MVQLLIQGYLTKCEAAAGLYVFCFRAKCSVSIVLDTLKNEQHSEFGSGNTDLIISKEKSSAGLITIIH